MLRPSIIRRNSAKSLAEIERFAADLKSNEALRAEAAKAEAETSIARVVAFAGFKGYAFTVDEAKEYARAKARAAGKELSDAELEGLAGGALASPPPPSEYIPGGTRSGTTPWLPPLPSIARRPS